eukprot:g75078.t1
MPPTDTILHKFPCVNLPIGYSDEAERKATEAERGEAERAAAAEREEAERAAAAEREEAERAAAAERELKRVADVLTGR